MNPIPVYKMLIYFKRRRKELVAQGCTKEFMSRWEKLGSCAEVIAWKQDVQIMKIGQEQPHVTVVFL